MSSIKKQEQRITPWLMPHFRKGNGRLRLFFFPHAGGGASAFYQWSRTLPSDIVCYAIQLPGRETRLREPLYHQASPLVQALTQELQPYLNEPYVFWGHSMGALLSFEVVRTIQKHRKPMPQRLIVSGYNAPQIPYADPHIHHLPQAEFLVALQELNGIPDALLQNVELQNLFLPIIRADFQLVETYTYQESDKLNCPITILDGNSDKKTNDADLQEWQKQSTKSVEMFSFSGDHFFLYERQPALKDKVINILNF